MRVLLLSRYAKNGASSRLRFFQYLPYLRSQAMVFDIAPLFPDEYLTTLYISGSKSLGTSIKAYFKRLAILSSRKINYDLIWIEKECFPWLPELFESFPLLRKVPYVVDFDDAIHHNYDQHPFMAVRWLLSSKLSGLVSGAVAVTAGNRYLADWAASQGANQVEVIPTVVELEKYVNVFGLVKERSEFRVGWIGMPATTNYLWLVRDALLQLSKKIPLRLVIIGACPLENYGVPLEIHAWNVDTEALILSGVEVGIMPLSDSHWEQGKCGYKLIQYMACGLPVVASPVGVNLEIVEHGVNGFLAENLEQWVASLKTLHLDLGARLKMGAAGREIVKKRFCLDVTAPRIAKVLKDAVDG